MEHRPTKPVLITPSASPPVSRSFFPLPYRIPDSSPPFKRQCLSSTSRPPQPRASSSSASSSQPDQLNFNHEREASTLRMLGVWSHLAERYTRRLDEDDIIDLTTGDIIKDRGVLRSSPQKFEMGCFADPDEPEPSDSGVGEGEGDDDVDELDAFAGGGDTEGDEGRNVVVGGRNVPPVRVMDPADAEDLREFMEAEKRRREECGSEGEEESIVESGVEAELEEDFSDGAHTEASRDATEELGAVELEEEIDGGTLHLRHQPPPDVDSESDDELGGWDANEGNTIYRIPKEYDDNDDERLIEVIEPPLPPAPPSPSPPPSTQSPAKSKPKSNATPKSPKPKTRPKPTPLTPLSLPPHQLQTPPQSQSSSVPSSTPDDLRCYTLPPSSRYNTYDSDTPTRPRSRSLTQRPPVLVDDQDAHTPRLDLTKVVKSKPKPKPKTNTAMSVPTTPIPIQLKGSAQSNTPRSKPGLKGKEVDERGVTSELNTSTQTLRKRKETQTKVGEQGYGKRLQAEVVIVQPTRSRNRTMDKDVEVVEAVDSGVEQDAVGKKEKEKGKGKERDIDVEEETDGEGGWEDGNGDVSGWEVAEEESDDPMMLSPSPVSKIRSQSQSRSKVGEGSSSAPASHSSIKFPNSTGNAVAKRQTKPKVDSEVQSSTPVPVPVWMGTRKRKRVLSSESVDVVPVKEGKRKGRSVSFSSVRSGTSEVEVSAAGSGFVSDTETNQKSRPRSTPRRGLKSKSRPPRSAPDSDSEHSESPRRSRSRSQAHRHRISSSPPPQPYYPYPQPPYTPHHPHSLQPHFSPAIQDPRAHYIISQAMHQLSSLFTAPWSQHPSHAPRELWTPYTPTHHARGTGSRSYSTPTHHPHPYAYAYDPGMSGGTVPPSSSPEGPSSAIKDSGSESGKGRARAKSLVGRSQSKGRRVSFRIDEGAVEGGRDEDVMDVSVSPVGARVSVRRDLSPPPAKGKGRGKGKEKVRIQDLDVFELECGSEPESNTPSRGRRFERGQTPGPPSRPVPAGSTTDNGKKSKPGVGTVGGGGGSGIVVRGKGRPRGGTAGSGAHKRKA